MTAIYEKLRDLMAQERAALRRMQTDALPNLLERKLELCRDLSALTSAEMAEIRKEIQENQKLLGATMDGFRAVQRRMASIHEIRSGGLGYGTHRVARENTSLIRLERRS